MTKLLEQAIAAASQLSEKEQDVISTLILEELASEQRWDKAFANSEAELAQLADEALAEFQQGKTKSLDLWSRMVSKTTALFRKAFAQLPIAIQQAARKAYQLWRQDDWSVSSQPALQASSPNKTDLLCTY